MGNSIKFIKNKLCKTCNKELYFENFRKVKLLAKGPNKGKYIEWTDLNGGKRFKT